MIKMVTQHQSAHTGCSPPFPPFLLQFSTVIYGNYKTNKQKVPETRAKMFYLKKQLKTQTAIGLTS